MSRLKYIDLIGQEVILTLDIPGEKIGILVRARIKDIAGSVLYTQSGSKEDRFMIEIEELDKKIWKNGIHSFSIPEPELIAIKNGGFALIDTGKETFTIKLASNLIDKDKFTGKYKSESKNINKFRSKEQIIEQISKIESSLKKNYEHSMEMIKELKQLYYSS